MLEQCLQSIKTRVGRAGSQDAESKCWELKPDLGAKLVPAIVCLRVVSLFSCPFLHPVNSLVKHVYWASAEPSTLCQVLAGGSGLKAACPQGQGLQPRMSHPHGCSGRSSCTPSQPWHSAEARVCISKHKPICARLFFSLSASLLLCRSHHLPER